MVYDKIKVLFFSPSSFFKNVKAETKYWDALKIFVVFYILVNLFNIVNILGRGTSVLVSYIIQIILLAFILPFVLSALFHILVRIFGGKSGYLATFKSIIYGSILFLIYRLIVYLVLSIYYLLTNYSAIYPGLFYTISFAISYAFGGRPWSLLFSLIIFILLIGLMHLALIFINGIKTLHKISLVRSIIVTIIGGVLIIGIMFWFLWRYWYLLISSIHF